MKQEPPEEKKIFLSQEAACWLARQKLTGEQIRVMYVLFGKVNFDDCLRVSRQEIAELLNMQPTSVSRAMRRLKELGIIIEESPAGKFKTYRFNPCIVRKDINSRV